MKTTITNLRNKLSDATTMFDDSNNLEIDFSSRNTSQRDINNPSVSTIPSRYQDKNKQPTRCVQLISIYNALGKNRFDSFQQLLSFIPSPYPTLIQNEDKPQSRSK